MNRRAFLTRFTTGVVGALALAHVPASVVKAVGLQDPARRYACEYLRRVYFEASRGGGVPTAMECGVELFEAYEDELPIVRRFSGDDTRLSDGPVLKFKGIDLRPVGRGWSARVTAWKERT